MSTWLSLCIEIIGALALDTQELQQTLRPVSSDVGLSGRERSRSRLVVACMHSSEALRVSRSLP